MQYLTLILSIVAGVFVGVGLFGVWVLARKVVEFKFTRKAKIENPEPKPIQVPEFGAIIEGKRYTTLDAKCIAQGASFLGYWWLMRTTHNNFFTVSNMFGTLSITAFNQEQASQLFTAAKFREVPFEQAFPDMKVVDA